MEQELAYSFHLGSDKNKSKLAKKVSKGNVSGTTSLSNNAIQNANDLSGVNKHNLRDYDNQVRAFVKFHCLSKFQVNVACGLLVRDVVHVIIIPLLHFAEWTASFFDQARYE